MTITRTRITVDRVQTSLWIFLEGEEDNEGCGDGTGWVRADSVDAETAVGDSEDDDVPVDINNSPEPKRAKERLIDNDYYSIMTQDWMIHFSLPISLFFVVLLVFAWFILIWIGVFGFFVVVVISEFVLVSRIFRKIWIG